MYRQTTNAYYNRRGGRDMPMTDKNMSLMYMIAMIFQHQYFVKHCIELEHQAIVIGNQQSDFIVDLILNGSYPDGVLQIITGLPESLIALIREQYLN